ncbi:uncharacterized protein LOC114294019 [Camellia sinensis]|uniref:uncharacterized protein LOC114294019 n=1 Tax=Camellia sinensis TaxID=4442 RepID=UPI0010357F38|nr:uncharacterized protein LOC114294019 [Camellia sinensis]
MQDLQNDNQTIPLTKEFKKTKPPQFHGGLDPLKVEAWVLGIEKLFEVFPCLETHKMLATFTLEDEARRWWMLIRERHMARDYKQNSGKLAASSTVSIPKPGNTTRPTTAGDTEQARLMKAISVEPAIITEIKQRQREDENLKTIIDEFETKQKSEFSIDGEMLRFRNQMYVPNISELKKRILDEAHKSMFAMHPGNNKMY